MISRYIRSAFLAIALLSLGGAVKAAFAGRNISLDCKRAEISRGAWGKLPDGGFVFTACGTARGADGGVVPVEAECVPCEAPPSKMESVCRAAWCKRNVD